MFTPWIVRQREKVLKTLKPPKEGEEKVLLSLAEGCCGVTFLRDPVVPQVLMIADSKFLFALVHRLRDQRGKHTRINATNTSLVDSILINALSVAVARLLLWTSKKDEPTNHKQYPTPTAKPPKTPLLHIMSALESCYDLDTASLAGSVLVRALDTPTPTARYTKTVLSPLSTQLVTFCCKQRLVLSSEPYAAAFWSIFLSWEATILGRIPDGWVLSAEHLEATRSISCKCEPCGLLNAFLDTGGKREFAVEKIGGSKRQHIEDVLRSRGRQTMTWNTVNTTPQGLMTLQIKKLDSVLAVAEWKVRLAEGLALLRHMSPGTSVVEKIFRDQCPRVIELLTDKKPRLLAQQPNASNPPATTTNPSTHAVPSITSNSNAPSTGLRHDPPASPQKPPAKR
ncbi:hypothetical protein FRB96_005172 [Tulasnella sp. 330]|nr:hypothetical protein FRB96_005172 [Tulasnella sp. 330]